MFDPSLPAEGSPLESAVMRSQFTSLKALVDALASILAAQVDGTTTLSPGDPAYVTVTLTDNTLHFTFGIPSGQTGAEGQQGIQGIPGETGSLGPPFANAVIDGVNTLNPGDPAYVTVSFDGSYVHFTFGIPRGEDGQPGEVTSAQLAAEIATTALNPSGVSPLSQTAYPDYDAGQMQQVMDKVDELLNAIKRQP